MSQENVRIALALVNGWNRGDREAFLALWDEAAEFYPLRAQLEGTSYRGRDGLERFMVEMREDWDEVRFEIEETKDAGDELAGIGRFRARGHASGVEINVPLGIHLKVRRGKVTYLRFFSEPAEALDAAGLSN